MSLGGSISTVRGCQQIVSDVERRLLNRSVLDFFKEVDFTRNDDVLQLALRNLIVVFDTLPDFSDESPSLKIVVESTREYASSLGISTAQLIVINTELSKKSFGQSFDANEHEVNVAKFREMQVKDVANWKRMDAHTIIFSREIENFDRD